MARYKGKHRKSSNFTRHATRVAVAGAVVASPIAIAAPASAADWDELAQCESSGNWHINTGNGFYGGLQFTASTWDAFGGEKYASNAHLASRSEQIAIAKKVLEVQGPGAWPACTQKTNWVSGSTSSSGSVSSESSSESSSSSSSASGSVSTESSVETSSSSESSSSAESSSSSETSSSAESDSSSRQASVAQSNGADYTVQLGDTLSEIGKKFGVSYQDIYQRNTDILDSPHLIFPGQQLDIR